MTSPPPQSSSELVALQDCVLSPFLYTLLTHECSTKSPGCHIEDLGVTQTQQWSDASSTVLTLTTGRRWCSCPDLRLHVCGREDLCSCISVWHGSCSVAEKKILQRVSKATQRTVESSLLTTVDIYSSTKRGPKTSRGISHSLQPPPLR